MSNGEAGVGLRGNAWAGWIGRNWAGLNDALDRQHAPLTEIGLGALGARPGERILDLGCGGGATTLALADRVAPGGHVTGIDISPDLLAIARARAGQHAGGRADITLIEADAATHPFEPASHDALFSRLGCMFFDDPPAAYAALARALRPGGRAVLLCFADPAENPWAMVPARAADSVLGPSEPPRPGMPGPFAWQDPDGVRPILAAAGFREIAFESHALTYEIGLPREPREPGEPGEPDPVERAVRLILSIGVVARRLADAPEGARAAVIPALRAALAPHVSGGWVRLGARIWVIAARL